MCRVIGSGSFSRLTNRHHRIYNSTRHTVSIDDLYLKIKLHFGTKEGYCLGIPRISCCFGTKPSGTIEE